MYARILVPVDFAHDALALRCLRVARLMAEETGEITLLHVIHPLPGYVETQVPRTVVEHNERDARARLEALGEGRARGIVVHGQPSGVILAEAGALGCDAIVLGSHRPDARDYLLGSTAARVVRHARCTVVVERGAIDG